MDKVLSVIVPSFNMEKYLKACLDSFILPSIPEKIEVIVVDDGSTDATADIAACYCERYPDTFRLFSKGNGGHGSGINAGIALAGGKYCKVVDADDRVSAEGFVSLVQNLQEKDADLVLSPFWWRNVRTGICSKEVKELAPKVEYGKLYKAEDILDKTFLKMHSYTVKTSILRNMDKRITEHCFYVDMEYVAFPLPYVKSLLFTEKEVYIYNIGMGSQSMDMKNMQRRCAQHEKVLENLLDYHETYREGGEVLARTLARLCARMLVSQYKIYLSMGKSGKEKLKQTESALRKNRREVYEAVRHPALQILRMSGYTLYGAISLAVRLRYFGVWGIFA